MEDKYDLAVRKWLGNKLNLDYTKISRVEFNTVTEGYCDTCAYETIGIAFLYGTNSWKEDRFYSGYSPGEMIREVLQFLE